MWVINDILLTRKFLGISLDAILVLYKERHT